MKAQGAQGHLKFSSTFSLGLKRLLYTEEEEGVMMMMRDSETATRHRKCTLSQHGPSILLTPGRDDFFNRSEGKIIIIKKKID